MENIVINQEFYEEYKDRVEELQGIFINIYSNYFYLIHIGEQRKTYKFSWPLYPAKNFLTSIIHALQKDFIILSCTLETKGESANSLRQLKGLLKKKFLLNFDSARKTLLKLPPDDNESPKRIARNKTIAHIDYGVNISSVNLCEVKERVDNLRDCFNSYLFGDMTKYKIDNAIIDKIDNTCKVGVDMLFNCSMKKLCQA